MGRLRVRRAAEGTYELLLKFSNRHVHAQLIDRHRGRVLVATHTTEPGLRNALLGEKPPGSYVTSSVAAAEAVGNLFAKRVLQKGYSAVFWDAPGKYHGKIKAFIDAVRAHGIRTQRPMPRGIPAVPEVKN